MSGCRYWTAALLSAAIMSLGRESLAGPPIPPDAPVDGLLKAYIERESAHFSWTDQGTVELPTAARLLAPLASARLLDVVSQEWRGAPWHHRVLIISPAVSAPHRAPNGAALLFITGSGKIDQMLPLAMPTVQLLGIPCAILMDVPNQPLLKELDPKGKGFKEDALIATTLAEFAKSGDPDWPLLVPMTRAAVAAMDAVSEWSKKQEAATWPWGAIEKFVVGGASKRGWTTWLTGAMDSRVSAIVPIVYDNLNIREQLALQREQYQGGYSEKIHDYVERGLFEMIDTPRGIQALTLIDPWTYRDQLHIPAFMLLATNDEYWAAGGITKYIKGLSNPAWPFYVTNQGHSMGGGLPISAVVAFVEAGLGARPLPPVASMTVEAGLVRVRCNAGAGAPKPVSVKVWWAASNDADMRDESWAALEAQPAPGDGGEWTAQLPTAPEGATRRSVTAEVQLDDPAGRYSVFAPLHVLTER